MAVCFNLLSFCHSNKAGGLNPPVFSLLKSSLLPFIQDPPPGPLPAPKEGKWGFAVSHREGAQRPWRSAFSFDLFRNNPNRITRDAKPIYTY